MRSLFIKTPFNVLFKNEVIFKNLQSNFAILELRSRNSFRLRTKLSFCEVLRIAIILGTRPEIIKMSPIIRELQRRNLKFLVLHTGQHYSYDMDRVFFEQLSLPEPNNNLKVGSGTHAEQTSKILTGVESLLMRETPDIVLVEGDTNTVLGGALAAVKLGIKVGHVEAGLRSYDRRMPEEINRILTDHCSDYLFTPTQVTEEILLKEGIPSNKIYVTGNTIVDAICQNLLLAKQRSAILCELELNPGGYFLATVHRQENVDNQKNLRSIIQGLELVSRQYELPVIFPIHPRTKKVIDLGLDPKLRIIDPQDYLSFLLLEKYAKLILTDSGGVQEEACIQKVPCVTLRENTERPETVQVGANIVSGINPNDILCKAETMLGRKRTWVNPYGDGHSAEKIIEIIINTL
jgi:UDP-N-acetylglucosamine 2-epimerase (non-hydrolysing)